MLTLLPTLAFALGLAICTGLCGTMLLMFGVSWASTRLGDTPEAADAHLHTARLLATHLVGHARIPNDGQGVYKGPDVGVVHPALARPIKIPGALLGQIQKQAANQSLSTPWTRFLYGFVALPTITLPALSAHQRLRLHPHASPTGQPSP